jgi:tRNA A37 threonylcarbamoyladenosine dehydratase
VHAFARTQLAIGQHGIAVLARSTVAVLGVGGVGSMAIEALARSGIGSLILIDKDVVDVTNINRQLHALTTTIGMSKAQLMAQRVRLINPACAIEALDMFYTEQTADILWQYPLDYVIDACDTVTYKIHIICACRERNIPIISSMGAANKSDPTQLRVSDISKTHTDPLAKVVRRELRKRGIDRGVQVVWSPETPITPLPEEVERLVPRQADPGTKPLHRKAVFPPSSNAFVPPVAGLHMVSVVVRDLLAQHPRNHRTT